MPDTPDPAAIARRLTPDQRKALLYVRNTGMTATQDNFDEDHDPIGPRLWMDLWSAGPLLRVRQDKSGRIEYTPLGLAVRAVLEQEARGDET